MSSEKTFEYASKCSYCEREVHPVEYVLCLRQKDGSKCICGECLFKVIDHVFSELGEKANERKKV